MSKVNTTLNFLNDDLKSLTTAINVYQKESYTQTDAQRDFLIRDQKIDALFSIADELRKK